MKRIQQYLREPLAFKSKHRHLVMIVPSVWVFLVIFFLQPLDVTIFDKKFEIAFISAITTAISSFIVTYIFPLFFKNFYNLYTWTKGKFLITGILILLITIPLICLYIHTLYWQEKQIMPFTYFQNLFIWYPIGMLIGAFPATIIYYLIKKDWVETKTDESESPDKGIDMNEDNIPAGKKITLSGKTKETLELYPCDFLYAEAHGNYAMIHYLKDERPTHKLLRLPLSQIPEILCEYPHIARCHRAFIVNTQHVLCMKNSPRAYLLKIDKIDIDIPVSRSYQKSIKDIISD